MPARISAAVRLVPVQLLRIVKPQAHIVLLAGLGQLRDRVAPKRRRIRDVEGIGLAFVHRKALVMLARQHDVLHPGRLGQLHPVLGAKADRVHRLRQARVLLIRNLEPGLYPFADVVHPPSAVFARQLRVQSPVQHQAEARLIKPFKALVHRILRSVFIHYTPAAPARPCKIRSQIWKNRPFVRKKRFPLPSRLTWCRTGGRRRRPGRERCTCSR